MSFNFSMGKQVMNTQHNIEKHLDLCILSSSHMLTPFNPLLVVHILYIHYRMLTLFSQHVVIFLLKTYHLHVYTDVSVLHILAIHNLKIQPDGMFFNVHA